MTVCTSSLEKGMEYLSFILLLGSLFVISGGIYVQGSLSGTPLVNTVLIGLGGLLASFIGTTGASMVLIRPMLRANAPRVARRTSSCSSSSSSPTAAVCSHRWATRRCSWAFSRAFPLNGPSGSGRNGRWSTACCC